MGNNICSCDKSGAEATASTLVERKKFTTKAELTLVRDSSMAKLMIPIAINDDQDDETLATPGYFQEEEHLKLKITGKPQILTPTGVVKSGSSVTPPAKKSPTREQELEKEKKIKENQLEEQLEEQLTSRHCRPLVELFKLIGSDEFKTDFTDDSPDLAAYLESTKTQLLAHQKLDGTNDLSGQLKFGS